VLLAVAGCGSQERAAPVELAPAPASSLPGTDDLVPPDRGGAMNLSTGLALLRQRPYWAGQDTHSTVTRAHQACKALEAGDEPLFGNPEDTAALIAFAVAVYCPAEAR
jgi:hypothetical protein